MIVAVITGDPESIMNQITAIIQSGAIILFIQQVYSSKYVVNYETESVLLNEDGTFVLNEDGTNIVLEESI